MATAAKAPPIKAADIFGGRRGFAAEIARQRKAEAEQRAQAPNILGTDVIAERDIDAAKLLMTTLGGEVRPITLDDLKAFSESARKLGKRYKGGITARGVIDHALKVDRERANEQIRTAVVMRAQAGMLHFVTNAGPDSDVVRHHVHVDFPAFKAYSASPVKAQKLARTMLDGPLRFDCDCGRHRFWFRYIATKGGFAAGRPETGYPKIRNPKLVGVACKHVLRVMQAVLKDAMVRAKAEQMIASAQANDTTAKATSLAEARKIAQQQVETSHHKKNQVETTGERTARLGTTTMAKARAAAAAAKKARDKAKATQKDARKAADDALKKLAEAPLTKAMRDKLIVQLQRMRTVD